MSIATISNDVWPHTHSYNRLKWILWTQTYRHQESSPQCREVTGWSRVDIKRLTCFLLRLLKSFTLIYIPKACKWPQIDKDSERERGWGECEGMQSFVFNPWNTPFRFTRFGQPEFEQCVDEHISMEKVFPQGLHLNNKLVLPCHF